MPSDNPLQGELWWHQHQPLLVARASSYMVEFVGITTGGRAIAPIRDGQVPPAFTYGRTLAPFSVPCAYVGCPHPTYLRDDTRVFCAHHAPTGRGLYIEGTPSTPPLPHLTTLPCPRCRIDLVLRFHANPTAAPYFQDVQCPSCRSVGWLGTEDNFLSYPRALPLGTLFVPQGSPLSSPDMTFVPPSPTGLVLFLHHRQGPHHASRQPALPGTLLYENGHGYATTSSGTPMGVIQEICMSAPFLILPGSLWVALADNRFVCTVREVSPDGMVSYAADGGQVVRLHKDDFRSNHRLLKRVPLAPAQSLRPPPSPGELWAHQGAYFRIVSLRANEMVLLNVDTHQQEILHLSEFCTSPSWTPVQVPSAYDHLDDLYRLPGYDHPQPRLVALPHRSPPRCRRLPRRPRRLRPLPRPLPPCRRYRRLHLVRLGPPQEVFTPPPPPSTHSPSDLPSGSTSPSPPDAPATLR